MNIQFTEREVAFRQEIREFLRDEPPETFPMQCEDPRHGVTGWSFEFTRRLGEKGWIGLTWPKDYGGQGRSVVEQFILKEELAYHRAPSMAHMYVTDTVGPGVVRHGTEHQKSKFLPRMAKGEMTFWLGLSEPEAGSDLLSLRMRAVENGDSFVVDGEKVWSTGAHLADFGWVLVGTDLAARHRGLSVLVVDMKTPGITVRPLINMAGKHTFNEVFFDRVRVPRENLVGEKNEGLRLLLLTLEGDRCWGRCAEAAYCRRILDDLIDYAKVTKRDGKPLVKNMLVRHTLAEMAVEIEVCRVLTYRDIWMLNEGLPLTREGSVLKVFADEMSMRLANVGMKLLGVYGQLREGSKWAVLNGWIENVYLESVAHSLGGGTTEIQKNTIATRGLGLPRG